MQTQHAALDVQDESVRLNNSTLFDLTVEVLLRWFLLCQRLVPLFDENVSELVFDGLDMLL